MQVAEGRTGLQPAVTNQAAAVLQVTGGGGLVALGLVPAASSATSAIYVVRVRPSQLGHGGRGKRCMGLRVGKKRKHKERNIAQGGGMENDGLRGPELAVRKPGTNERKEEPSSRISCSISARLSIISIRDFPPFFNDLSSLRGISLRGVCSCLLLRRSFACSMCLFTWVACLRLHLPVHLCILG